MKTKAIYSFFILFAIAAVMISSTPAAFADHTEVAISTADNDLATPGCVETEVGCYTPNTTTVEVGGVVTMTNADESGIHTFTSGTVDGFAATADETFDSGILQFGDSFEYTADTAGEFPYYCMLHVWMQGVLIVEEEVHAAEAQAEADAAAQAEADAAAQAEADAAAQAEADAAAQAEADAAAQAEADAAPQTHTVDAPAGTSVPGCEETNSCFTPADITINAGDTVEWNNIDTAAHTVTSGSPADGPSGVFDSSLLMADATFAFTFEDAGEYDYFCMVHPWMVGSVSVN